MNRPVVAAGQRATAYRCLFGGIGPAETDASERLDDLDLVDGVAGLAGIANAEQPDIATSRKSGERAPPPVAPCGASCSRTDPQPFDSSHFPAVAIRCRGAGGERGIRTLDTLSRIHAFQACAFNHSATSPHPRREAGTSYAMARRLASARRHADALIARRGSHPSPPASRRASRARWRATSASGIGRPNSQPWN